MRLQIPQGTDSAVTTSSALSLRLTRPLIRIVSPSPGHARGAICLHLTLVSYSDARRGDGSPNPARSLRCELTWFRVLPPGQAVLVPSASLRIRQAHDSSKYIVELANFAALAGANVGGTRWTSPSLGSGTPSSRVKHERAGSVTSPVGLRGSPCSSQAGNFCVVNRRVVMASASSAGRAHIPAR